MKCLEKTEKEKNKSTRKWEEEEKEKIEKEGNEKVIVPQTLMAMHFSMGAISVV